MAQPITHSRIDIDLRVLPHTCYRASDRARPRWRFLLAAINRPRRGFLLRRMTIVQRTAKDQTQRTVAGKALVTALAQSSVGLPKKGAIVLDVQEPADRMIARKEV